MLVLTSKMEDGIQIGEDIRITVLDVRPRNVRLGIEAPQSIAIARDPAATRNGRNQRSKPTAARLQPERPATACKSRIEPDGARRDEPCRELPAPSHRADVGNAAVMLISRDQPLLSRLRDIVSNRPDAEAVIASSITEGKRSIAARQAVDDSHAWPALIVLDIDLSPQTTMPFLRWLRQSERRHLTPVLALRSEHTPHSTTALLTAGANVVVRKDLAPGDFKRCIASAIDLWRHAEPESAVTHASYLEATA